MPDPNKVADQLTPADLLQFTAVDRWYSHWLGRLAYSDGVKYFADRAQAYWFLDIIATEFLPMNKQHPQLFISLEVQNKHAVIEVRGDGRVVVARHVQFTDCPPGVWQFYMIDNSLLLPGQY